jgi:hypothetical protein
MQQDRSQPRLDDCSMMICIRCTCSTEDVQARMQTTKGSMSIQWPCRCHKWLTLSVAGLQVHVPFMISDALCSVRP